MDSHDNANVCDNTRRPIINTFTITALLQPPFLCRGSLFLMTYLLFPVNVLLGVLLGIWRVVITALFNIIHLGRMDISLLNRNVEAFDPSESRLSCLICLQLVPSSSRV